MNNKIRLLYKTVCSAIAGLACLVSLSGFSQGAIEANTTKEVVGANSIHFDWATKQMKAWLEAPKKDAQSQEPEAFREAKELLKDGKIDLYAKINSPVGEISIKHYLLAMAFKQCKPIFTGYELEDHDGNELAEAMYRYDPTDYAPEGRSAEEYTKKGADYRPETLKALVQMQTENHFFREREKGKGDFFECIDVQKLLIVQNSEGSLKAYMAKVLTRNVSFEFLRDAKKLVVRSVEVKDPVYVAVLGKTFGEANITIIDEKTYKKALQSKLKDGWTMTEIK